MYIGFRQYRGAIMARDRFETVSRRDVTHHRHDVSYTIGTSWTRGDQPFSILCQTNENKIEICHNESIILYNDMIEHI